MKTYNNKNNAINTKMGVARRGFVDGFTTEGFVDSLIGLPEMTSGLCVLDVKDVRSPTTPSRPFLPAI